MSPAQLEILKELIDMEARGELDRASFDDIPIQVYHHPSCPGISSTTIKTVLKKSWNHVGTKGGAEKDSFRFGSAFHCLNNEPHLFNDIYIVCPFDSKRGEDWKGYKESAGARGKILLLQKEFRCLEVMSKKLWLHPDARELMTNAQFEVTYFVRDQRTGVLKKCRVDSIKRGSLILISDLKTTWDASPDAFSFDCRKYLYRISASYYSEIVSEFYGELVHGFYLIPCEKVEPYEITVYKVPDDAILKGGAEIAESLDKIAAIQKDPKAWRGYPLGATQQLFI